MPVRFLKNGTLHITIVPPWYTDNLIALKQTLHTMEKPKKVTLTFSEIDFGPKRRNPRLIWITGLKSKLLQEAQKKFERVLGVTPEKRPLLPHITIARLLLRQTQDSARPSTGRYPARQARPGKKQSTFQKSKIHWKCTIKTFCLMESRLKRTGAVYRVLHTYLFSTHTRG